MTPLRRRVSRLLAATLLGSVAAFAGDGAAADGAAAIVNPWMITPFVLLLLAIAIMPFINRHWWERFYPLVCAGLGLVSVGYYLLVLNNSERMVHTGMEYLSFIILIGSLFVVAGGIHIRIKGKSRPLSNTLFLASGAVISNLLGTTGASMIMIRPFLRANNYRLRGFHVVFFIFLISNMGGALTPIGDPPLFLGYLKGVPFFWVLASMWYMWVPAILAVLLIFYLLDAASFRRYERRVKDVHIEEFEEEAEVSGLHNLIFLVVILGAVFIQQPVFLRELLMLVSAAGSYLMTKPEIHRKNDFNFGPIKEVAILFVAIFATMVPALDWLEVNASQIGISTPGQFYWGTGILSSVLDNAPTYLNFLSAAVGLRVDQEIVAQVQQLVQTHGAGIGAIAGAHAEEVRNTFTTLMTYHGSQVAAGAVPVHEIQVAYLIGNHDLYLKAISLAAVFFGANTYIGNGPNFMVKSIAEQAGAEMPSFFGYVVRYSLPVLLPIFAILWWVFFRGA